MDDLAELGFEGVDKFARKFHDPLYDKAPRPKWGKKHQANQSGKRGGPTDDGTHGSQRDNGRRDASMSEGEDAPRSMYGEERDRDRRDRDAAYSSKTSDRGYNGPENSNRSAVGRGRDPYDSAEDYEVMEAGTMYAARAADRPRGEDDRHKGRGRPSPSRRRSSYSPPRHRTKPPPEKRARSKSPTQRVAAALIGAVAGGLLGNSARKGGDSTIATVGGAIMGGIAGMAAEKEWDRREGKSAGRESERNRRRRDRDRDRDDYYN